MLPSRTSLLDSGQLGCYVIDSEVIEISLNILSALS